MLLAFLEMYARATAYGNIFVLDSIYLTYGGYKLGLSILPI